MTKNPVLFLAIVNDGMASRFLKYAQLAGATGGTIIKAEGTVSSAFLNFLGLHDEDREILLTVVRKEKEMEIHDQLKQQMGLIKNGTGVLFSFNISSCCGNKLLNTDFRGSDRDMFGHQMIVTIVDRNLGDDVVEAARQAGASGATILHGRGVGNHETGKIFNIQIEPEKEIVIIVADNQLTDQITTSISETMNIKTPGKGLLFTLAVNQATGLYEV